MKHLALCLLFVLGTLLSFSQEESKNTSYKEDQFYLGITYNLLAKKPKTVTQSGFSSGFQLGFIKDIPINKSGTLAIGVGTGYSINSYIQNMLISRANSGAINYNNITTDYTTNRFHTHSVEFPFELRWRNSTATEYKFWRIYTGFKVSYIFSSYAKHEGDLGKFKTHNITDFNSFQYGLTMSMGYNTWNLHLYYGLNTLFSESTEINNTPIDLTAVKLGLQFYIL